MTPAELRLQYLRRLNQIAQRLPNGLLMRLVEDADFFAAWQRGKRQARGRGRMQQQHAQIRRADDAYWKQLKQGSP